MAQWNDSLPVKLIHTLLLFPFTGASVRFSARKLQSWEPAPNIPTGYFTSSKQQSIEGWCDCGLGKQPCPLPPKNPKQLLKTPTTSSPKTQVSKSCFIGSNFLFPS